MTGKAGRHIHLSPLGGIAGDMFVAALLDALPDLQTPVMEAVGAVLPEDGAARLTKGLSGAIAATRFGVTAPSGTVPARYPDMARMIDAAPLDPSAREIAGALLRRLAEAEAAVHRVDPAQVHFHEIADWDTLADLTAAGVILSALDGAGWSLDSLPLGGGRIQTRHGWLPVPAPATARLLEGLPVHDDGIGGERVTPTGAAIAAEVWARRAPRPGGTLGPTGYGAGTRDLPGMANVLAAQVMDTALPHRDAVWVLEFDIDDMTGEEIATSADHLRRVAGVIDVTTGQRSGKKGRTVTAFRLLVQPAHETAVAEACFQQCTTLGLRMRHEARLVLPRAHGTAAGTRVKQAQRPGGATTTKAEADDLADEATLALRRQRARKAET